MENKVLHHCTLCEEQSSLLLFVIFIENKVLLLTLYFESKALFYIFTLTET